MSDENLQTPAGTPNGEEENKDIKDVSDEKTDDTANDDDEIKTDENDEKNPAGPETKRVVPEKHNIKLPKDSLLNQANLEKVVEFAKANKLTNEEAQAVIEHESAMIAAYVDNAKKAAEKAFVDTQNEWIKELKNDKEFGGEAFSKNAELAKRVIQRFADEKFIKDLDESGFGNHPGFTRFMFKLGKAMSDDKLVPPTAPPSSGERKSTAEVLFGK